MSIEFKSNPLQDVLIFSGIDVNLDKQINKSGLTGEAANRALQSLQNSYDEYKKNLNLKYGQFLHNVEENITEFNKPDMPFNARVAVSKKLTLLARKRILAKEKKYSKIYKTFHKIGQYFKGHGFRTKGEWGLELASRMVKVDLDDIKSQLEKRIFSGKPSKQTLDERKEEMNHLTDPQFKEVLRDVIFQKKEASSEGEKNKYIFYKNLDSEKWKIFDQQLLSRTDWYEQALDMIEGSDEVEEFVSKGMVEKFKRSPQKNIREYAANIESESAKQFFYTLLESAIQDHLASDSFSEIGSLLNAAPNINLEDILASPQLLTPEDIKKIKENIHIG